MKKSVIALLCACAAATVSAHVITPAEALGRVYGLRAAAMNRAAESVSAPDTTICGADGLPALYVFNSGAGGFMMLSADSEAEPVVGYADSGSFSPDSVPDNLKAWLGYYAAEIAASRTVSGGAVAGRSASRPYREPLLPIVTTKWNQDSPYNLMCPDGCATGCVATAMAQVLRVLEYPAKCSGGTYSYEAENLKRTLSLDFNGVTLDWADMTDTYGAKSTEAENNAVATLMYAVGVASQMDYGPSSGTSVYSLAEGLIRNFGYSNSLRVLSRDWYELFDWEDIVYAELEKGVPVYYDGGHDTSAHAFVIDGYDTDGFFHVNWGWGGMSDGYFLLSALDPTSQGIGGSLSGYNFYQHIITGLAPKGTTAEEAATANKLFFSSSAALTAGVASATIGSNVTFSGGSFNMASSVAADVTLSIKFTSLKDGSVTYANNGFYYPSLPPFTGFNDYTVTIPSLKNGEYEVSRIVLNKSGEVFDVLTNAGAATLVATVTNTRITFASAGEADLEVVMGDAPEAIYAGMNFPLEISVTNVDQTYYHGGLRVCLSAAGNPSDVKAVMGHTPLDLYSGDSVTLQTLNGVPSGIAAGKYMIIVIDSDGHTLYASQAVEVCDPSAVEVKISNLKCVVPALDGLIFECSVVCGKGYFADCLYLYVFDPDDDLSISASCASNIVMVNEGETAKAEFRMSMPDGVVGKRYLAALYMLQGNTMKQVGNGIYFNLGEAGIESVAADADADAPCVDLLGRPVDASTPGLHITPRGKTLRLH